MQSEYLSYLNMGKDLKWMAAAENNIEERWREERIHRRHNPQSFLEACFYNNLPFVVMHWASQHSKVDLNAPGMYAQQVGTPLMFAAQKGNLGVVRFLLDHGADPSIVCGEESGSALHWAMVGGNPEVVRLLLDDPRTDPNQRNNANCDAALSALAHGNLLAFWMITEDEFIETQKAERDGTAIPQRQYHKMDPNLATTTGHNLLHYAAWRNQLTACQYLIERWKFKVDPIDNLGRTPLIWASREGNAEVVEYLLKAGADPLIKDKDGMTALQYAETRAQPQAARALKDSKPRNGQLSSRYRTTLEMRAQGTFTAIRDQPMFRYVAASAIPLFFMVLIAVRLLPPIMSYLAAGIYFFRNYPWLLLHGIPTFQDGSNKPDLTVAFGRTLMCCLRGTWITRYRNPANLIMMTLIILFQCYAWTQLGLPPLLWFSAPGKAGEGGSLVNEFASGSLPSPETPLHHFFCGWWLQLFLFRNPNQMITLTLNTLLFICFALVVFIKLREGANVIRRRKEVHWSESPLWSMLSAREFNFYHPRSYAINRNFLIPLRCFYCKERDAYIERFDNYANALDSPISSSNKQAWVYLLSFMTVFQLLMAVWGVQLVAPLMKCQAEDTAWWRLIRQVQECFQRNETTILQPEPEGSPKLFFVDVLANLFFQGLPCRQTAYLHHVAATHPRLTRWFYWFYLPSMSSYYGVFVFQLSVVLALFAGALAFRQWKSVWYGASVMEMANPVAPREDGKLVSIFVPANEIRKSIECHNFDVEEEIYFSRIAPHKVRCIPPKGAHRCIYAITKNGFVNIFMFLIHQDGRKWRRAKAISANNTPATSTVISSVVPPSFVNLEENPTVLSTSDQSSSPKREEKCSQL